MKKYILVYSYHDTYVEYFENTEKLRSRCYELLNQYRNDIDFHITIFKISNFVEFC